MTKHETRFGATGASRRAVIKGMAATAVLVTVPRQGVADLVSGPIPTLPFLEASSRLTGILLDRSYMQMAEIIWSLLTIGGDRTLKRLVTVVNTASSEDALQRLLEQYPQLTPAARTVMTAWYTGNVEVARKQLSAPVVKRLIGNSAVPAGSSPTVTLVFNYDEALVWRACSYTKASATCGGPFGYWHDAPSA